MTATSFVPSSRIRAAFARAMSDMYRHEVPQYGQLLQLVQQINQQELAQDPELQQALDASDNLQRLSDERHGAIRVGSASELATLRRLFAVMGMYPVAYYDLSEGGIPVHSTAFRPLQLDELNANPFRIFTSLLRLDLIKDQDLHAQAQQLLASRSIFTDGVIRLIEQFEQQQGLTQQQAGDFVQEALETFRWHQQARVDRSQYQRFLHSHRLIADIVCFRGPHINHLTPRTLNIDRAQLQMQAMEMNPKAIIEGPPRRKHPILLRQTSFKALDEDILFFDTDGKQQAGSHTARFGEIEQRGMALTPKGRDLYDQLLQQVRQEVVDPVADVDTYYRQLDKAFAQFPDDLQQIWQQQLGYFRYRAATDTAVPLTADWNWLLDNGHVHLLPITYEDFLPVSAAGIFHSNLQEQPSQQVTRSPNQAAFEQALGCPVISEFEFYAQIQARSIEQCLQQLGFDEADSAGLLHEVTINP
ncbi:MAG: VOC family protein [Gammaproteobacteria bacterium]|nr:VOC family protein [Gammaproteobacteria bacterium]